MRQPKDLWEDWESRFSDALLKYKGDKTDAALGDEFSVSRGAVNHWLRKKRAPELNNFFRVCKIIHADPAEILFGKPVAFANELSKRISGLDSNGFDAVMIALEGAESRLEKSQRLNKESHAA